MWLSVCACSGLLGSAGIPDRRDGGARMKARIKCLDAGRDGCNGHDVGAATAAAGKVAAVQSSVLPAVQASNGIKAATGRVKRVR